MNRVRPPSPAAVRAYRRSDYSAPGLRVRVGRRPVGWPLPGAFIVLLSACNPSGVRLPDGENRRRMAALVEYFRAMPYLVGEGRLGRWSEALLVVAISLRRARVLARRFGQNAVVALKYGCPARLIWLV